MSRSAKAKYCSKACKNAAAYQRRINTTGAQVTAEIQPVEQVQE